MAINKAIIEENGTETTYHRIDDIKIVNNHHIEIVVFSYVSQTFRQKNAYAKTEPMVISWDEISNIKATEQGIDGVLGMIYIYLSGQYDGKYNGGTKI